MNNFVILDIINFNMSKKEEMVLTLILTIIISTPSLSSVPPPTISTYQYPPQTLTQKYHYHSPHQNHHPQPKPSPPCPPLKPPPSFKTITSPLPPTYTLLCILVCTTVPTYLKKLTGVWYTVHQNKDSL